MRLAASTAFLQVAGKLIGTGLEFCKCELLGTKLNGNRLWRASDLRREKMCYRLAEREVHRCGVTLDNELLVFRLSQQRESRQLQFRIRYSGYQQNTEVLQ